MDTSPRPAFRRWILVVEDDHQVRTLWVDILTRAGYSAVGCDDGFDALDLVRAVVPHLIVLDLRLARTSGMEFLQALRETPRLNDIPVLIVSGHLESEELVLGVNVVRRLAKPVGLDDFLEVVRTLVGPGLPPAISSP